MTELNHYKGIPKKVRIGCYVFRVEVRDIEDHEAEGTFGHMNPIGQKIALRPGMTPQCLANVFLHEVMHGIYFFLRPNHSESAYDTEEEFVLKGANGLVAFWQDNPKAMAWWQRILRLEAIE